MTTSAPVYNVSLSPESPVFTYLPFRDSNLSQGWNASYTGDATYPPPSLGDIGSGTPYRRTQRNGASVSIDFQGTALYLCFTMQGGSSFYLSVDGQGGQNATSATGSFCPGGATSLTIVNGLGNSAHTALLTASLPDSSASNSTANFQFYGGIVTVGAGPAGSTLSSNATTYIDDRDSNWQYLPSDVSPQWTQDDSQLGDYDHTRTFTCMYNGGSTATYTFTGAAVAMLLGGVDDDNFGYTINFDASQYTYNGTNYWASAQQILFFIGGLDPTQKHTITAINYNANQPLAPSEACFNIDALVLVKPTSPQSSTSSSSSLPVSSLIASASTTPIPSASTLASSTGLQHQNTPAGTIAGAVIGGIMGILLIGLFMWWIIRRRLLNVRFSAEPGAEKQPGSIPPALVNSEQLNTAPTPYVLPLPSSSQVTSTNAGKATRAPYPLTIQPSASGSRTVASEDPASTRATTERSARRSPISPEDLQQASTMDLIQVLNQRLRAEQADNVEEPPSYVHAS